MDIPEGLLRRARARAALDGTKMKDVVNEALRKHLESGEEAKSDRHLPERVGLDQIGRFCFPVIRSPRPGRMLVTPEQLKAAEAEEDLERHGEIFGR